MPVTERGKLVAYLVPAEAPTSMYERLVAMLARIRKIEISDAVIESAGRLPDPMLRSPDAIHLATALLIRDDIDTLVNYDDRLLATATSYGLPTAGPA